MGFALFLSEIKTSHKDKRNSTKRIEKNSETNKGEAFWCNNYRRKRYGKLCAQIPPFSLARFSS
jgi:hypothetical protein